MKEEEKLKSKLTKDTAEEIKQLNAIKDLPCEKLNYSNVSYLSKGLKELKMIVPLQIKS